ncbi:hypothetical protein AVEN_186597-1 [Araneus ventricosus]|uniref:Uncharacterized protein n=1 Tax=Araneus ventricosus TaxID=182803 RepID=A0A4Y2NSA5_ARAVE|nr:hypothetical protein AVEN_186597-1 [Araneus ventricosus]
MVVEKSPSYYTTSNDVENFPNDVDNLSALEIIQVLINLLQEKYISAARKHLEKNFSTFWSPLCQRSQLLRIIKVVHPREICIQKHTRKKLRKDPIRCCFIRHKIQMNKVRNETKPFRQASP